MVTTPVVRYPEKIFFRFDEFLTDIGFLPGFSHK
jgi:hypothetical protein